jgi:hypothetical protein
MRVRTSPSTAIWAAIGPAAGSVNWGRKARKNSAVFGFRTATTTPLRNRRRSGSGRVPGSVAVSSSRLRSALIPSQIR